MRSPRTMCAANTTSPSFEWQSALFGDVAPGAASNKINYQVATRRPGGSSGFVSSRRLRCVDAAALINQLPTPALTIAGHSARRASSTFVVPVLQDEAAAQRRSRSRLRLCAAGLASDSAS